jgi:hypothetical protein
MRYTFHDAPEGVVRKFLGENAVRVYDLDRDALVKVAARVGPTVSEVATPVDEVPEESDGYAFRVHGKWS